MPVWLCPYPLWFAKSIWTMDSSNHRDSKKNTPGRTELCGAGLAVPMHVRDFSGAFATRKRQWRQSRRQLRGCRWVRWATHAMCNLEASKQYCWLSTEKEWMLEDSAEADALASPDCLQQIPGRTSQKRPASRSYGIPPGQGVGWHGLLILENNRTNQKFHRSRNQKQTNNWPCRCDEK